MGVRENRPGRRDADFQTGNVTLISLAHLSHDVYSAFLAPLLPLLIAKLGLSLSAVGLLDVARKVPQLSNPLIGLLADRVCVKWFVILAPAVTATAMSLLGVAPSFSVLFILLLISGFSAAAFHVPGPVLIKHHSGARTGRGMSFYMFGGELARTLGPLLITAAVSWWGLEGSWRVLPVGLLISVLLFSRLRGLAPVPRGRIRQTAQSTGPTWRGVGRVFSGLAGFLLFRTAFKSALTLFLPTYLTGEGHSLWGAGIALSIVQFSGAIGTLGAGWVADRLGHRRVLLVITLLTPLAAMGLTFLEGALTLPLLVLSGVLIFASSPILLAVVQDLGSSRPAFLNSLYMTLSIVISGLGALLVGSLGDRLGLAETFRLTALLSAVAIPFVLLIPGRSPDSP
ncbi:MFS transporter [bacterium DOLZORAL124_64_63]|nr:MAG: MFS transporter [bacterium DOLZORAL124_64_63]